MCSIGFVIFICSMMSFFLGIIVGSTAERWINGR